MLFILHFVPLNRSFSLSFSVASVDGVLRWFGSIVVCMAVVLFRSLSHGLVTQRLSKHIIALISCPGSTTYWPMRFWACHQSSVKFANK